MEIYCRSRLRYVQTYELSGAILSVSNSHDGGGLCLVQSPDVFTTSDASLHDDHQHHQHHVQFVTTSSRLLDVTDAAAALKTTHIVIHNQTLSASGTSTGCDVKESSPPPPTPATPLSSERGFRYQWDATAFEPVLPVRCKSSSGELHKARFGSGNACIVAIDLLLFCCLLKSLCYVL